MSNKAFIPILLLFGSVACSILQHNGNMNSGVNLEFLGNIGKIKPFFVDRLHRNWTTAKAYCEEMNMKLASIETVEEQAFLFSRYRPYYFQGYHWTAARDAFDQRQFVWDATGGESISPSLNFSVNLPQSLPDNSFLTCGVFYLNETWSGMTLYDCSYKFGFVLCEN